MIGVLIVTHGGFAEGLLSAVELIAGKQEKVKTIGLYHGDGIDEFGDKVKNAYEELDDGDGVMIFVDILGGSPSNVVMKLMAEKSGVMAIAGVNMPMLVEAVMSREGNTLEELCNSCWNSRMDSQVLLHEEFKAISTNTNNDDDDNF